MISLGVLLGFSLLVLGTLSDFSMDLLVKLLNGFGASLLEALKPLAELDILSFGSLQSLEIFVDVDTEDSLSEDLVVSVLIFGVESGESRVGVGDVDTSVSNSLEDGENLGAGGGGLETNIEVDSEGSSFLLILIGVVVLLVGFVAVVHGVETDLFEESSGDEETSGISGGIVGETSGESEVSELVGVSSAEDLVTLDGGVDDLGDDSGAGEPDNESVLRGVVFVLVLDDESLSGEVVGLSGVSSLEFGLEAHEVSLVLDELDECHLW